MKLFYLQINYAICRVSNPVIAEVINLKVSRGSHNLGKDTRVAITMDHSVTFCFTDLEETKPRKRRPSKKTDRSTTKNV